jgi:hypothetical protein
MVSAREQISPSPHCGYPSVFCAAPCERKRQYIQYAIDTTSMYGQSKNCHATSLLIPTKI